MKPRPGHLMAPRAIVGAKPSTVAWVSESGQLVTFADAPDESCNVRDYHPVCKVCRLATHAVDKHGSCANCGAHADRDPHLPW